MAITRLANNRQRGFSLIEVLIVLAIAGILVTMSFGYLIRARPHAQLERAELLVSTVLLEARGKAISEEMTVTVGFDVDNSQLWIEWTDPDDGSSQSMPATSLPEGIAFDGSGIPYHDGEVLFTPRGSLVSGGSEAAGGVIVLINSMGETATLTANVATGRFPLVGGNLR